MEFKKYDLSLHEYLLLFGRSLFDESVNLINLLRKRFIFRINNMQQFMLLIWVIFSDSFPIITGKTVTWKGNVSVLSYFIPDETTIELKKFISSKTLVNILMFL